MRIRILRIQLILIEFAESLAQHLPDSIASRLKLILEKWRDKINVEVRQEVVKLAQELQRTKNEVLKMRSMTTKLKNHPPKQY